MKRKQLREEEVLLIIKLRVALRSEGSQNEEMSVSHSSGNIKRNNLGDYNVVD